MTEREILERCRARDPEGAAALVARHQKFLFRMVMRLVGQREVAEEMVQEAFLRTFAEIDRVDPDRGAGGWLARTAVNLVRSHRQRRGLYAEVAAEAPEDTEGLFSSALPGPEESALSHESRLRVERAVGALPDPLREVVVLHYVEGLSFPEISRILGAPVPALKMRALRARRRLRALLAEWQP